MNFWNQFPLLRILIPFIAGILFSIAFQEFSDIPLAYILSIVMLTILAGFLYSYIFKKYSVRWIFGALLSISVFAIAVLMTFTKYSKVNPADLKNIRSNSDTVIATIDDPVVERENSYKAVLEINSIKIDGSWQYAEGKVMAYFQKDSTIGSLKYGDRIMIATAFTDIKGVQNPNEFDYRKYLAMRSIYLQAYIKSGKWTLLEHDKGNYMRATALSIREKFLKIFSDYGISGDEYAVAGALILGYTDKLDQDLISIYSGSGALHILSVSGMHVGVVFIVLSFLLAFLDRTRKGKYIKPVILVLLIWFYAAITGFSPAVNRAAAMITFVIVGKMMGRSTNIYNTLAASALFLLILNPLLIADVGFQLSYIAVFGIVLLQKKIQELWQPSNWLVMQVWSLISVSIAAQIATFPLSIFYFHQFPNYFLLTNLVVVPFSNLIIYSGMLVLIVSPLAFLAAFFSKVFVYMLYGLNYSIRFIESLPYAVTHNLSVNTFETIVLYIAIAFVIAFIFNRRNHMLRWAAVASILFFISLGVGKYDAIVQRGIVVYNVKKSTVIDLVNGRNHFLITDSLTDDSSVSVKTHVKNNWIRMRLNDPVHISRQSMTDSSCIYENGSVYIKGNIIQFYDKRLGFVDDRNFRYATDAPIAVDYLVISGNIKADIEELLESYQPKMIIFDSSNSLKKTEKWSEECEALNVPYYAVLKSGAFDEAL
jgi:competence protein ComEC